VQLRLPQSNEEWAAFDDYVKAELLPVIFATSDVQSMCSNLVNSIYDSFSEVFGTKEQYRHRPIIRSADCLF
jgi:hypothetical protein